MPIDKRLKRELKKNFIRYLLIGLMLALGISIISAFISGADGIEESAIKFNKEANVEDATIICDREINKEDLSKINGIEIESKFYKDCNSDLQESFLFRVFKDRKNINKQIFIKGRKAIKDDEISVSSEVASVNNLDIGDKLRLENKDYKVVGLSTVPDYTEVLESEGTPIPNYKHFGIAFVTDKAFKDIKINENFQYSVKISKDSDYVKLNNILKDKNYSFKIDKSKDNIRIHRGFEKATIVKKEAYIMGIAFICLVIFIFYVISLSSIEKDSALIGALISMGYTSKEVGFHYLKIPIFITTISTILGLFVGVCFVSKPLQDITYKTYALPDKFYFLRPYLIIVSIVLPIILQLVFNGIILHNKISGSIVSLLRKQSKRIRVVRFKLKKFSFETRFSIRILLRGFKNQIILFLGIVFATFFFIMGLGLNNSTDSYIKDVTNNKIYKNLYILNAKPNIIEDNDFSYVKVKKLKKIVKDGKGNFDITLYGINDTKFIDKMPSKNKVFISDAIAWKFNLKKGDKLELEDEFKNNRYTIEVEKIIHEPTSLSAFMRVYDLNEMLGEDTRYNAIMSKKDLNIDNKFISSKFTDKSQEQVAKEIKDLMTPMIRLLMVLSFSMYFIVVYMLLNMIIEKSAYSISLMKVFGYTNKENNRFYINSFFITVMISVIVAMYVDSKILIYIWPKLSELLIGYMPMIFYPSTYIIIFITAITIYFIVTFLLKHSLNKIPMELVLKSRD